MWWPRGFRQRFWTPSRARYSPGFRFLCSAVWAKLQFWPESHACGRSSGPDLCSQVDGGFARSSHISVYGKGFARWTWMGNSDQKLCLIRGVWVVTYYFDQKAFLPHLSGGWFTDLSRGLQPFNIGPVKWWPGYLNDGRYQNQVCVIKGLQTHVQDDLLNATLDLSIQGVFKSPRVVSWD